MNDNSFSFLFFIFSNLSIINWISLIDCIISLSKFFNICSSFFFSFSLFWISNVLILIFKSFISFFKLICSFFNSLISLFWLITILYNSLILSESDFSFSFKLNSIFLNFFKGKVKLILINLVSSIIFTSFLSIKGNNSDKISSIDS